MAGLVDADPERVWAWAFVARGTTGLFLRWHGYDEKAEAFLSIADVLARSWSQARLAYLGNRDRSVRNY